MDKSTFAEALVLAKFTSFINALEFSQFTDGKWRYADPGGSEATQTQKDTIKLKTYSPFNCNEEISYIRVETVMVPQLKITKVA